MSGDKQTVSAKHEHAARLADMLAQIDSGALSIELLTAYREIIRLAVESLRETDALRAELRFRTRDMFAASALDGMLAHECGPYSIAKGEEEIDHGMCDHYAKTAYALADAMLRARGGKP